MSVEQQDPKEDKKVYEGVEGITDLFDTSVRNKQRIDPEECDVEYGMSFGGFSGVILVKGSRPF